MKLLKQNKPQCLLYAFAMAYDVEPEAMIEFIGHDGMEVWWPSNDVRKYRGFHHQEMIDYGLFNGFTVTMVEGLPNLGFGDEHRIVGDPEWLQGRIHTYLQSFSGVLTSDTHAVAWDGQKCYDPNGIIYGVDNFQIREFFIVRADHEKDRIRRTLLGKRTRATVDAGTSGVTSATATEW